jgi:predicted nucleic acid-binding protein
VLLVDTNIWLAAGDRRSRHHDACTAVLADHAHELAATTLVIAETAWLLLDRAGPAAQTRFVTLISAGQVEPVDLTASDWQRVLQLITAYADLSLDIIDASTIAIAERFHHTTLATLDHRDFATVQPAHTDAFHLIP